MLPKLSADGIQGQLHTWLTDFFSRSQRVPQQNPLFSSTCQGWSAPNISLTLWKIPFFYLLMTPHSAVTSLLLQTGRLQLLPSLQTFTKSQAGQTLGICLSILTNPTLSLSERTIWQTILSTFLTILLRKFSHTTSWVSPSAMISLGKTTFQSWPPKPAADWASSAVQLNSPSLAHLNSYPCARLSSAA